jgi:hypothetical protein
MYVEQFHYAETSPYVAAVQWDGVNREPITEFVRLVYIEQMGANYCDPTNAFRFTADDGDGDHNNMVIFEQGEEVEVDDWVVCVGDDIDQWLEVMRDEVFKRRFRRL